ncbi:hypothetical protein ACOME3_001716 [Neoechinorhynchus agilis]
MTTDYADYFDELISIVKANKESTELVNSGLQSILEISAASQNNSLVECRLKSIIDLIESVCHNPLQYEIGLKTVACLTRFPLADDSLLTRIFSFISRTFPMKELNRSLIGAALINLSVCAVQHQWSIGDKNCFVWVKMFLREKESLIGMSLANLCALKDVQKFIISNKHGFLAMIAEFLSHKDCEMRKIYLDNSLTRMMISKSSVHYKSFPFDYWDFIEKFGNLFLFYPLIGNTIDYDNEEKLPIECQYLNKMPDDCEEVINNTLDCLLLLCATKRGRERMRRCQLYFISKQYYEREDISEDTRIRCEKLIAVLISDEPENDKSNLMEVNIPEDVEKMLAQMFI